MPIGKYGGQHAEGMAESAGAAIRVDMRGNVGEAEFTQARARLCRKGLVEFENVDVTDRMPVAFQKPAGGKQPADTHDACRDARRRRQAAEGHGV